MKYFTRIGLLSLVAILATQTLYANDTDLKVLTVKVDGGKPYDKCKTGIPDGSVEGRFIPVELFTGGNWDGEHELRLKTVSTLTSACASQDGTRCTTYHITGPFKTQANDTKIEWAGDNISYYLRTFSTRSLGNVESFFAINNSRDGLVRIYDKRNERGTRTYDGLGSKFPLGCWEQGEVRSYPSRVPTRIEIIELDGLNHCLTFRWTIGKEPFRRNSDNNYTFCPDVGLLNMQHNS